MTLEQWDLFDKEFIRDRYPLTLVISGYSREQQAGIFLLRSPGYDKIPVTDASDHNQKLATGAYIIANKDFIRFKAETDAEAQVFLLVADRWYNKIYRSRVIAT